MAPVRSFASHTKNKQIESQVAIPKLIVVADPPFGACVPICLFPFFLENRLEGKS